MINRLLLVTMLSFLLAGSTLHEARAQELQNPVTLRGQITSTDGQLVLYPATIRNKNTGARVFSDQGGYYRINANPGDQVLISFIGYVSDSVTVTNVAGTQIYNARLKMKERFLPQVEVSGRWNPYQLDSIARYEEFRPFLEEKSHSLVDTSKRSSGGFGITFSPFTRGSRQQKDLRKFKKLYEQNEVQRYIDYRYSKSFVSRVTGFTGDTLLKFMQVYTPSYGLLRRIPNEDLIVWISVRAKQWREDPKVILKENDLQ